MTPRKILNALRATVPRVSPAACADRIRSGNAVLVDVRERHEWQKGFAATAILVPLTDLTRSRVNLTELRRVVADREMILYCGAGVRSNLAARVLQAEGFRAVNGGALREWAAAGWPMSTPAGV